MIHELNPTIDSTHRSKPGSRASGPLNALYDGPTLTESQLSYPTLERSVKGLETQAKLDATPFLRGLFQKAVVKHCTEDLSMESRLICLCGCLSLIVSRPYLTKIPYPQKMANERNTPRHFFLSDAKELEAVKLSPREIGYNFDTWGSRVYQEDKRFGIRAEICQQAADAYFDRLSELLKEPSEPVDALFKRSKAVRQLIAELARYQSKPLRNALEERGELWRKAKKNEKSPLYRFARSAISGALKGESVAADDMKTLLFGYLDALKGHVKPSGENILSQVRHEIEAMYE